MESGLPPVSAVDRDAILDFAKQNASSELYLMLALGFFTGMRLGTICDLRIDTLEQSIPYMILLLKALLLIPNGTPVTQNNVGKEAGSDP